MKFWIPILLSIFLFSSCKEENKEATLRVNFKLAYDGQEMNLFDEVVDENGDKVKFETLKIYFSDFELNGENKSTFPDVALLDFSSSDKRHVDFTVAPGNISSIQFGIGLTPDLNATDPVVPPATDPLSANQAMYWAWASKYIFYKIEGRADTGSGQFDHFFLYHIGTDDLFRHTRDMSVDIDMKGDDFQTLDIWIDMAQVFNANGVSIRNEPASHTLDHYEIAEKLADKFPDAFIVD